MKAFGMVGPDVSVCGISNFIAILAAVVSTDQIYEALTPDLQHAVMHETYLSTSCASLQEPFRPTKPRQGMKQETGHGE